MAKGKTSSGDNKLNVKKDASAGKNNASSAKFYLKGVKGEVKKVHWPTRSEIYSYTAIVFFMVILVSLIMWLFDSGLSFALDKLYKAFA